MQKSLVKDSVVLREAIQKRIRELGLSFTRICEDAQEKGYKLSISALSRYFKDSDKNKLSEEDIIWLSYRYCIFTYLSIGVPQILEQKIKWVIPPYDEEKALGMLKMVFPDTVKKTHIIVEHSVEIKTTKKGEKFIKEVAKEVSKQGKRKRVDKKLLKSTTPK